ncbi:hypothetical protein G9A89_017195 [Geosiphon pyriformis]|nr:hypothetical protein G9A89_017195 [Geosiphon pyriformis]
MAKINRVYLHQLINSGNRKCVSVTIVVTKNISKLTVATTNLSTASISTSDLSAAATSNISTAATNHLSIPTNSNTAPEPSSNDIRQLLIQSHSKLEISNGCSPTNSPFVRPIIKITHLEFGYQLHPKPKFPTLFKSSESNQHVPTNTISLATISSDEFLAAIFPFELKENTLIPLFNGATFEEKPITVMYTNARVDGHSIKLILDSHQVNQAASARIITADRTTKTPIVNATLDWNTQELQLIETIDRTGGEEKKAYLGSLPKTDDLTWTDNDESKLTSSWKWEEDKENKGKGKEKETTQTTTTYNTYTIPQRSTYRRPKLIYIDCGKKLSLMGACCGDDEEYHTATKFYCRLCLLECFR